MKELSIEEKAKAYDEAIARANELNYVSDRDSLQRKTVEHIFPELTESEDEKIRNFISNELACLRAADEKGTVRYNELTEAIAWLEKQAEHANFRNKIQIGDKVTRNEDGVLVNLSQLKRVAKPADKVEPKFKIGDWIVSNGHLIYGNSLMRIVKVGLTDYLCRYCNGQATYCRGFIDKSYHLWTIQDAKDGDVLACESGWICIFKKLNHNSFGKKLFDSHCFIDRTEWFHDGTKGHTLDERINGKIYPATKEQRDLLFKKMKEASYEWDAEKKELKKIEQKHFCKLDNSYARVKFPFKAKVKSSGKIVTIHDGQLSYDGKEWIKYQSDAEDGYKIYEPNNLLELVCEIEQNPAWSEEEEKILSDIIKDLVHPWDEYIPDRIEYEIKWLKNRLNSLKNRVQPKQGWSEEDEDMCYKATAVINRLCAEGKEYVWSVNTLKKLFYWLKSLKDRVQPQNTWKPSDEQIKGIECAIKTLQHQLNVKDKRLNSLYNDLKKL